MHIPSATPRFLPRPPRPLTHPIPSSLGHRRLSLALATILLNVGAVAALTRFPRSDWKTGLALNVVDLLLLGGFDLRNRDRFLGPLLGFGWVLGMTELAADAWLVDGTRTLDYSPGGGPMIWHSPVWMPLAWQVVAVRFAIVGERLRRWLLDGVS